MKKIPGLDGFRWLVLPNVQKSNTYNLIEIFLKNWKRGNAPQLFLTPDWKDSIKKENQKVNLIPEQIFFKLSN